MAKSISYSLPAIRLKAIAWCNKAERCQQDARNKFHSWSISHSDTEALIAELISLDLINEYRYASAFVNDKSNLNGWGINKIRAHLKARGISEQIIRKTLSQIAPSETLERAILFARKKLKSLTSDPPLKKKAKLYRALQSRGFDHETIATVMRTVESGEAE